MQWVSILLIGIAANIDNLAISVSYGLKLKRIPFLYNFIISLISIVFAFFSISAGSFLFQLLFTINGQLYRWLLNNHPWYMVYRTIANTY